MRTREDERFEVSPELKAVLLESIAQCERGETISAEQLLEEMLIENQRRGSSRRRSRREP